MASSKSLALFSLLQEGDQIFWPPTSEFPTVHPRAATLTKEAAPGPALWQAEDTV